MVGPTTGVRTEPQVAPPPPPPPPPRLSPVDQGAQARRDAELTQLQRTNYPEYVRQMQETLAPADRANPFTYSLDHAVPIEVKRQVFAEYQSGQNAPRTEVTSLSGSNATYTERDGPNGTIRVNADLIGNDPARRGQTEAFAVWGHMEEVGHWADARAQQIMGTPGGDAKGDEGARYALLASGAVTDGPRGGDMIARYDIPVTGGPARAVEVDTVVLKVLAAEKLANGSFARENRVGGVENFGPEGHYQTTYITAAGAASALGLPRAEADQIANRLALGSQLPDMLENFDAASQFKAKASDIAKDAIFRPPFSPPSWTPAEQRHLESVYEGLHALPRDENANAAWLGSERQQTAAFIRERIAANDFVTAGVAIHRYGDLHAHVKPEGIPYSGDLGHGLAGHTPDYMYTEGANGRAAPWAKAIDYQASLSNVIAGGLVDRQQRLGRELPADAQRVATEGARTTWRNVYDSALATSAKEDRWFGADGADNDKATETYFRNSASAFINEFHRGAGGRFAPLPIGQTGVGGGYGASPGDIRSLDLVRDRFDAFR